MNDKELAFLCVNLLHDYEAYPDETALDFQERVSEDENDWLNFLAACRDKAGMKP
jgi:hypothetical protein